MSKLVIKIWLFLVGAILVTSAVALAEKAKTINIYTDSVLPSGQALKAGKYQVDVNEASKQVTFRKGEKVVATAVQFPLFRHLYTAIASGTLTVLAAVNWVRLINTDRRRAVHIIEEHIRVLRIFLRDRCELRSKRLKVDDKMLAALPRNVAVQQSVCCRGG